MTQPVNTAEFLGVGKKKEKWNYSLFQSVVLSSEIKIYFFGSFVGSLSKGFLVFVFELKKRGSREVYRELLKRMLKICESILEKRLKEFCVQTFFLFLRKLRYCIKNRNLPPDDEEN